MIRRSRSQTSPDEAWGELFSNAQSSRIEDDEKLVADLIPRRRMRHIQQEYLLEKQDPHFDIRDFMNRHFYSFSNHHKSFKADPSQTVSQHISLLWDELERTNTKTTGSLVGLPYSYIVPGGRFNEQFYWDSYFIMLGLAADNRWTMIEDMINNFAYMLENYGMIPTANRTYFLSRSQPPFFSHMIKLLARHKGEKVLIKYLPYLLIEHRFWMRGHSKLAVQDHRAFARVAQMPRGTLLNRYYDNKITPRPESMTKDVQTAAQAASRQSDRLFLHLRAGAESGWDFSSRWLIGEQGLDSIHTADIIPVDLNSLLYHLEETIAGAYRLTNDDMNERRFHTMATRRKDAVQQYCWDDEQKFFGDYNFHHNELTGHITLAGVYPLFVKIASAEQAKHVADRIKKDFLKEGGLATSLEDTGQQWDAPNGWAPLHYIVIQGLRNYGYHSLAQEIKSRWVKTNLKVFNEQRKLVEKYNVEDISKLGAGGEYPLQDGFGWTNGVLAALMNEH